MHKYTQIVIDVSRSTAYTLKLARSERKCTGYVEMCLRHIRYVGMCLICIKYAIMREIRLSCIRYACMR